VGNVYIFRGLAGVGKTTLADMLGREFSIPVFRKDDIVDALKMTANIDVGVISNATCYNILCKMVQTNLDLGGDFILDIALGHRQNAEAFLERLDFGSNKVFKFLIVCSDEKEWEKRHLERIANPLPHQVFKSFEHVLEHYKNVDTRPFDDEHVIDTACVPLESLKNILNIVK
jgi:predicted kinase